MATSTGWSIMEEQQQPINLDNEVDAEQPNIPAVGDKRTAEIWNKFNDIRDPKSNKVVKARCKKCDRVLKVETRNGTSVCIDLEQLLNDVEKYEHDIGETIEGISGLSLS